MKMNRIIFSGLVTCLVGMVIGIAVAEINQDNRSQNAHSYYGAIGAVMGLTVGAGQQVLRDLKQQEIDQQ
ncbi:MAG: hypothetical protein F6K58_32835 [Symploca sp. SIO2E9]|nr:hypothetical protein [Symploca sp. SIO2E9]